MLEPSFTLLNAIQDEALARLGESVHSLRLERAHEALAWADVVIATGTTLLNGSLAGLLSQIKPQAEFALIGPSVPLLSQSLTQAGVTLLGGARVVDAPACLDLLAEGASGYHLFERSITRVNLRLTTELSSLIIQPA